MEAGLDPDALSLAVASMNIVKLYRATKSNGKDYKLWLATELTGHGGLVRDVAWADGSLRGSDTIATACKDGYVRIFDVTTPTAAATPANRGPQPSPASTDAAVSANNAPSGIGAGLAGATSGEGAMPRRDEHGCKVKHAWKQVACLDGEHGAVWRVKFARNTGDTLASGADDGMMRFWKKGLGGEWLEFAEIEPQVDVSPSLIISFHQLRLCSVCVRHWLMMSVLVVIGTIKLFRFLFALEHGGLGSGGVVDTPGSVLSFTQR